jgi:hypothetical protein
MYQTDIIYDIGTSSQSNAVAYPSHIVSSKTHEGIANQGNAG